MIVTVRISHLHQVWSTHRNRQLDEVLDACPSAEYGVLRTDETCVPFGPLPHEFEMIQAIPEAEVANG